MNFAQGLGNNVPPQYLKTIEFGRMAADVAATEEWGHQIIFTDHALGGGLASAGAIAARKHKAELRIEGRTYNAAGLHENTAATIPAAHSDASDVPIRARHVHSEILNSMQSRNRIVPLLADFLFWGSKSMPTAVPNAIAQDGHQPRGRRLSWNFWCVPRAKNYQSYFGFGMKNLSTLVSRILV